MKGKIAEQLERLNALDLDLRVACELDLEVGLDRAVLKLPIRSPVEKRRSTRAVLQDGATPRSPAILHHVVGLPVAHSLHEAERCGKGRAEIQIFPLVVEFSSVSTDLGDRR